MAFTRPQSYTRDGMRFRNNGDRELLVHEERQGGRAFFWVPPGKEIELNIDPERAKLMGLDVIEAETSSIGEMKVETKQIKRSKK